MEKHVKDNVFNIKEIRTYIDDFECIKYLFRECNCRKMDSNLYYELLFFKDKFERWIKEGIEDAVVKLQIEDFKNCIDTVLNSVTDEDTERIYNSHTMSKPLNGYDEIRYKNTNLDFNLGYTRELLTRKTQEKAKNFWYDYLKSMTENYYIMYAIMLSALSIFTYFIIKKFNSEFDFPNEFFYIILFLAIPSIIDLLYRATELWVLIKDSKISYETGIYRIQKPEEYVYFETANKNNDFKIYDKVWRNQIVAFYKYNEIPDLQDLNDDNTYSVRNEIYDSLIDKSVSAKEKFQLLVNVENHYVTYFAKERETLESVQRKVDEYLESLNCVNY